MNDKLFYQAAYDQAVTRQINALESIDRAMGSMERAKERRERLKSRWAGIELKIEILLDEVQRLKET